MGRPKNSLSGFYGLERAEEDVYRLEQIPREAGRLEEARRRLAKLQAALAEDAKAVEEIVKQEEEIAPYREHAAAQGMTIVEYITKCRKIELGLYRCFAAHEAGDMAQFSNEFMDALCQMADWIGFDPVQVLMSVNNSPSLPARVH